jgi:hypothetical protein
MERQDPASGPGFSSGGRFEETQRKRRQRLHPHVLHVQGKFSCKIKIKIIFFSFEKILNVPACMISVKTIIFAGLEKDVKLIRKIIMLDGALKNVQKCFNLFMEVF